MGITAIPPNVPTVNVAQKQICGCPVCSGSGGINIKSGKSTSPKATEAQVDFGSAFNSIPRVALTPHDDNVVWLTETTVIHFKWNNSSKNVDVTVDWIATDASS